jgi:hypothetical protein
MTDTKHPGDPRSNEFGEQPFDPNEYPGVVYEPPKPPPPTPNVLGFVPYRGGEQHGVELQEPGRTYLPYAKEAAAHQSYADPTVTPRDIVDIVPVQVEIVSNPTLIQPRKIRFQSYNIPPSVTRNFVQVLQAERLRKRAWITASGISGGIATVRYASNVEAIEASSGLALITANTSVTLVDSEVQDPIYIWVVTAADATVVISVTTEYYEYDGSKLL